MAWGEQTKVEHEHDLTCFKVCEDCEGKGCPEITPEGLHQFHCEGGIRWRYCHGGKHSSPHMRCILR
jgi:hypothetical protein